MGDQTVWRRLHPQPRNDEMTDALRAPIRDPMWMLSRQWQVGEFEGEDAGSPADVDLTIARDHLDRVDHRGGSGEQPVEYDDGPLETIVERETITREDPPLLTRVDAGQQFLRILADEGVGEFTAENFPEDMHVDPPEQPLESADRHYVELVDDRALDGYAVAEAIAAAVSNIGSVVDGEADSWSTTGRSLPLPNGVSRTETVEGCVEDFYEWYVGLYDEPTPQSGSAWDPQRLAYRFAVSTGAGDNETVFEVDDYRGGSLEWSSFSVADGDATLGAPAPDQDGFDLADTSLSGPTTSESRQVVPTRVTFPGMPVSRWWEFEDGDVHLAKMTDDGASLPRLLLTEFATQYGNDWFQIPVETPVGSLSRILDLTVTDTFGVSETAEPALQEQWQLFMQWLPNHDQPGLFVPPTLSTSTTGEPVEEVTFARDEMANLVFAIEETIESPTGRAVDRTAFQVPRIEIDRVSAASDPDEEYVTLANPGEDVLDVDGYTIAASTDGSATDVHTIRGRTLDPGETLSVYTGTSTDDGTVSAGLSTSVWTTADAIHVSDAAGDLTAVRLLARPSDALADYRLSSELPDYWYPFTPEQGWNFTLERALLLEADTLGLPLDQLPMPRGEILNPDESLLDEETYRIFDEEITSSGRAVSRRYQFARWTDGTGHLWSSRETRVADTQLSSGLQFDTLEERE